MNDSELEFIDEKRAGDVLRGGGADCGEMEMMPLFAVKSEVPVGGMESRQVAKKSDTDMIDEVEQASYSKRVTSTYHF